MEAPVAMAEEEVVSIGRALSMGNPPERAELRMATLTAPVRRRTRVRSARLPAVLRHSESSPAVLLSPKDNDGDTKSVLYYGARGTIEEEKLPLPDNVHVWARYGFLDGRYLPGMEEEDDAESLLSSSESGRRPAGRARVLVRLRSNAGETWQEANERERTSLDRECPTRPVDRAASTTAASSGATAGEQVVAPPGGAAHSTVSNGRPRIGPLSPDLGASTPPTVVLTPCSQERCRQTDVGGAGDGEAGNVVARSFNSRSSASAAQGSIAPIPAPPRDSLSASAAAAVAARATAEETAATVEAAHGEEEETKDEELRALEQEAETAAYLAASLEADATFFPHKRLAGNRGRHGRRPPRSMAEVERHKRNRAERLRAYGCSRTLYPRIVPGSAGGGAAGAGGCAVTEEMETEQWVDTLRVSASLRGESLMAACTQSFVENRAVTLLGEKQSEARASRTADVSEMEGPDGLLHCAVLKGDHALAARAAQFLVDKRGASVNSRDAWGRTPLHTACGKGMVPMARFFIRRGANVDALDQDNRTPLWYACAGGNTTMARYLTRIEVGSRVDLRDNRGHLAGENFWDTVDGEIRDEIVAVLVAAGWPDPPPPRESQQGGRGCNRRSQSMPGLGKGWDSGDASEDRGGRFVRRQTDGGEAGMKRLASEMRLLMKRR